jgi:hypothetical protein
MHANQVYPQNPAVYAGQSGTGTGARTVQHGTRLNEDDALTHAGDLTVVRAAVQFESQAREYRGKGLSGLLELDQVILRNDRTVNQKSNKWRVLAPNGLCLYECQKSTLFGCYRVTEQFAS